MSVFEMKDDLADEAVEAPTLNPGAASNQERSGDRDLYFSWLMRQPHSPCGNLKACDCDVPESPPTGICHLCGLPFLLMEVTRERGFKATWYTKNHAAALAIDGYLVRHDGQIGKDIQYGSDRKPSNFFEVTRLLDGKTEIFCQEQAFIKWIERKYEYHLKTCRTRY